MRIVVHRNHRRACGSTVLTYGYHAGLLWLAETRVERPCSVHICVNQPQTVCARTYQMPLTDICYPSPHGNRVIVLYRRLLNATSHVCWTAHFGYCGSIPGVLNEPKDSRMVQPRIVCGWHTQVELGVYYTSGELRWVAQEEFDELLQRAGRHLCEELLDKQYFVPRDPQEQRDIV